MRWIGYFLLWTTGITATGALLGAVIFPIVGIGFENERTVIELSLAGIKTLGFYFGIWAPGTALVLTVKKAYEANRSNLPDG